MARSSCSQTHRRLAFAVVVATATTVPLDALAAPAIAVSEAEIAGRWPATDEASIQGLVRDGIEGVSGFDVETASRIRCTDEKCRVDAAEELGVTHILVPSARFVDNDAEIRLEVYDGRTGALVASVEASCEICAHNEVNEMLTATAVGLRPRLEALLERPGALVVDGSPPGADVVVDGQAVGETPYSGSIPPGSHVVVVRADGYRPSKFDVYVEAGKTEIIESELRDRSLRASTSDQGGSRGIGPLGYAGIATGLAGLAFIGSGIGLLAINGDRVKSTCPGGQPDINGRCPRMYETRVAGISSLAVGGAAFVAGVTFLVLDRTRHRRTTVTAGWRSVAVEVLF